MKLRTLFAFLLGLVFREAQAAPSAVETYGPYVSQNEGFRNSPYHCTEGHYTVGVGHLLRTHEAIRTYTNAEIAEFFQRDLLVAVEDARHLVPNFDQLPIEARQVLVDMAFQMGRTRLSKFYMLLWKIRGRLYSSAAWEIEKSEYRHQCPKRAQRNADLLESINS